MTNRLVKLDPKYIRGTTYNLPVFKLVQRHALSWVNPDFYSVDRLKWWPYRCWSLSSIFDEEFSAVTPILSLRKLVNSMEDEYDFSECQFHFLDGSVYSMVRLMQE